MPEQWSSDNEESYIYGLRPIKLQRHDILKYLWEY